MGTVDRSKHGAASGVKPKLRPEDCAGQDVVVVTVENARLYTGGDFGEQYVFDMPEFPDRTFYLNKTGVDRMCDTLGDDTDKWNGKRIALRKEDARNPSEGKDVEVYHIAKPADQKRVIEAFDKAAKKRGR